MHGRSYPAIVNVKKRRLIHPARMNPEFGRMNTQPVGADFVRDCWEQHGFIADTGLVTSDDGARYENACAAMLLCHAQHLQDAQGKPMTLHYIRDKEGREIDFVLCESGEPTRLVECKLTDPTMPTYLVSTSERFPEAKTTLLVRHLRQPEQRGNINIERAAEWLARLET